MFKMDKRYETILRCGKVMSVSEKRENGICYKTKHILAFGKNFYFDFVNGKVVAVRES